MYVRVKREVDLEAMIDPLDEFGGVFRNPFIKWGYG
jgi:hypothetical protein